MTDRFIPAGVADVLDGEIKAGRADFLEADLHGRTTVMGLHGLLVLEQVVRVRGQAWPQAIPPVKPPVRSLGFEDTFSAGVVSNDYLVANVLTVTSPVAVAASVAGGMQVSGYVAAAVRESLLSDFELSTEVSSLDSGGVLMLVFRFVDADNWLSWTPETGSVGRFRQRIAGVSTDTNFAPATPAPGQRYSVRASGSDISFYQGTTLIHSLTSSQFQTATRHGVGNAGASGAVTYRRLVAAAL